MFHLAVLGNLLYVPLLTLPQGQNCSKHSAYVNKKILFILMYAVHFYKQCLNRPKCNLCRGLGKQGYFTVGRDFSKLNGTPGNAPTAIVKSDI